jgi:hypothetical protein
MANRILLNDGSSKILLNDGSSFLLMNLAVAAIRRLFRWRKG